MQYSIYELSNGKIEKVITCTDEFIGMQFDAETHGYIDGNFQDDKFYVEDGVAVVIPHRPTTNHIFDFAVKQWYDPRTLNDIKALRRAYVNEQRVKANQSSFTYLGKAIAADALSRSDIDATQGYVLANSELPQGWPGGWKCIDNTYLPITTVAEWNNFYSAMVMQGLVNFAHAQALKAAIAAVPVSSTAIQEVEAIVW